MAIDLIDRHGPGSDVGQVAWSYIKASSIINLQEQEAHELRLRISELEATCLSQLP